MRIQIPSSRRGFVEAELARASSALGKRPEQLVHYAIDWNGVEQWTNILGGTGATAYGTAAADASCVRVSSGATASSQAFAISRPSGGQMAPLVPVGVTGRWYISSRFKLETVPDAQTDLAGIGCENETLTVGAYFNASVFRAAFQTGNVLSTKALDTGHHEHRLARTSDSATVWTIDDADSVSANMYPTAARGLCVYARNGTTAANQSLLSDWIFVAYPRP